MDIGTYTVTISVPEILLPNIETYKNNYIEILRNRNLAYIVARELNKSGIVHYHIYYDAPIQKSTSNETKKFNKCYNFDKKQYPKAILHRQHKDPMYGIGYAMKDDDYKYHGYSETYLKKCQEYYENKKKENEKIEKILNDKINNKYYTQNEIADLFVDYANELIKDNPHAFTNVNYDYFKIMKPFFKTIRKHIAYTTLRKLNYETLYQYWKINKEIDSDDEFI